MGFRKGDIVLNTWAYHLVPAGLGIDEGLRSVGATVIPAGTGNTELQVRIMHDLKVTGFCGTTGFLMNIIKKAEELGYDFKKDFSLRLANAGGEMGGGPMREIFEKEYGITTRDAYGTADLGLIAYECSEKTGMHLVGDAIVEIVDPKTGKQLGPNEVGEVVVTPFDEVYPLIRFSTGDLSAYADEPCPCGRTSPRLLKIMGRVGDAVRVRGMFVHPKQTDEVISRFPEISRYQVVVTRPEFRDEMVFKIELADENIDKEKLQSALDTSIRDVCKVRADRIEFVAKGTIPEERKAIVDERVY
jgi:phenylacetate-CoA ligase